MPKVINKSTGKTETVTAEELETIKGNPMTAKLYTYKETPEPEEVTNLKNNPPAESEGENK